MWKKILIGLACVILAGALAFGIRAIQQEEEAQSAALRELNQQMDTLRGRKVELESALETARQKLLEELRGTGTFTLLITDLHADWMEQLVLDIQQAELPAVMALSLERFPGNEGLITLENFQERLADGWDYCVAYNGTTEFEAWYKDMLALLEANGMSMPQVLYFEDRCYTEELEKTAKASGFETIVHSGEQGMPIVDTEFGSPWRIGSVRWIATGARGRMEQAVNSIGSMAFVVDQSGFTDSEFNSMLRLVGRYQEEESLLCATFTGAKEYRAEVVSQLEAAQNDPAFNESIGAMERELESVDEQIQALIESQ